jgi:hypothetical protein
MAALYRSGKKLREIAEIFGCTDKNVHACMKKIGVSYRDGGRIKLAAVRKAQRKARSEAISFERYGCPRSESLVFRGEIRMAYSAQKVRANQRGIAWQFTLPEWWGVWERSGHWHERGRGAGYMMCRKGDEGPYAVDNVFIATGRENSSQARLNEARLKALRSELLASEAA